MAQGLIGAIRRMSPGPLQPKKKSGGSSSGGGGGVAKKACYVGVVQDGDVIGQFRHFKRWKISDLPGGAVPVPSARIEWHYINKASPTGDVALIEINDFGTLAADDWGIAERATIAADFCTPATPEGRKISRDVTTRYNQAKSDGLPHFAVKLQYETEDEGVGPGRWYQFGDTGSWAPTLVVTVTAGEDLRFELLATPVQVNLAHTDALGHRAAVITAGDGDVYPPLGEDARLAATVTGLVDDATGTYTGTPGAAITKADIIRFLWASADEGCGLDPAEYHASAFDIARTRLADWIDLAGGLTDVRDVREWVARLARSLRAIAYLDQLGRETIHVEPTGGSGATPIRLVRPWEHGVLQLRPLVTADAAQWPISQAEVFYAPDLLGLSETGWLGHAIISHDETDPPDAERQAQAVDAHARYRRRDPGDQPASPDDATGYEFVPIDQPGASTGVRLLQWIWDQARARPIPAQVVEVDLGRYAAAWRLGDEFQIESYAFPSALGRMVVTATDATPVGSRVYAARRARCMVQEIPRLTAESGAEFPVHVIAQIIVWETS